MDKGLILKGIADNPALLNELKTLLLEEFTLKEITNHTPNEVLGQIMRANLTGREAVERAFSKILEYRTPQPKVEGKHPGR